MMDKIDESPDQLSQSPSLLFSASTPDTTPPSSATLLNFGFTDLTLNNNEEIEEDTLLISQCEPADVNILTPSQSTRIVLRSVDASMMSNPESVDISDEPLFSLSNFVELLHANQLDDWCHDQLRYSNHKNFPISKSSNIPVLNELMVNLFYKHWNSSAYRFTISQFLQFIVSFHPTLVIRSFAAIPDYVFLVCKEYFKTGCVVQLNCKYDSDSGLIYVIKQALDFQHTHDPVLIQSSSPSSRDFSLAYQITANNRITRRFITSVRPTKVELDSEAYDIDTSTKNRISNTQNLNTKYQCLVTIRLFKNYTKSLFYKFHDANGVSIPHDEKFYIPPNSQTSEILDQIKSFTKFKKHIDPRAITEINHFLMNIFYNDNDDLTSQVFKLSVSQFIQFMLFTSDFFEVLIPVTNGNGANTDKSNLFYLLCNWQTSKATIKCNSRLHVEYNQNAFYMYRSYTAEVHSHQSRDISDFTFQDYQQHQQHCHLPLLVLQEIDSGAFIDSRPCSRPTTRDCLSFGLDDELLNASTNSDD